jgi:transposase-like protein
MLPQRHMPAFGDEDAAYRLLEEAVWPQGPVCPRCKGGNAGRLRGVSTRAGTYKCYDCRKPFTVKIGTMLEGSHVPLRLWLQAIFLLNCAAAPPTTYQLSKLLGVSLKTATQLVERIGRGRAH